MAEIEYFPQGQERKDELDRKKKAVEEHLEYVKRLKPGEYYDWTDSSLDAGSPEQMAYFDSFRKVLPEGSTTLRSYIQNKLRESNTSAERFAEYEFAADFGGIGSEVFRGFDKYTFKKMFGVTLHDHRDPQQVMYDNATLNEYGQKDHVVEVGNIFFNETYNSLNKKLDGKKLSLIFERMGRGHDFTPEDPHEVARVLDIWYKMLREGGVMFVQTPVVFNHVLEAWGKMLQEKFGDVIEFQYSLGTTDTDYGQSAFRLVKLKGAPEKLPMLDFETVRTIPKYIQPIKNPKDIK